MLNCPRCQCPDAFVVMDSAGVSGFKPNILSQRLLFEEGEQWEHRCKTCKHTWLTKKSEEDTSY